MSLLNKYGPWALIAGASEGIGSAFAEQLAAAGINLVLLSRSQQKLDRLNASLADSGVERRLIAVDLTAENLLDKVREHTDDIEVGLLIYNAGATHSVELFHEMTMEQSLNLVNLNCRGPVVLAHHLGGKMRERRRGGMIFLSSMAAFVGGSYVATYAATKSFDIIFPQSLWHEMAPYDVDVMSLVAGATRTPAMEESGLNMDNDSTGEGGFSVMEPEDVAREGLEALGQGPVWIAGASNREIMAQMETGQASREEMIEMMSMANAHFNDKPYIPVKGD